MTSQRGVITCAFAAAAAAVAASLGVAAAAAVSLQYESVMLLDLLQKGHPNAEQKVCNAQAHVLFANQTSRCYLE